MNQNSEDQKAGQREEYVRQYASARSEVIDAVTRLGKLRHPEHGQPDVADFLGSTLASAAANLGSTDALLAGRSGSWEADAIGQLVRGTVGHDDEHLMSYRTEPVRIPLHVARLLEENEEYGLEDERDAIADRYEALYPQVAEGQELSEQDLARVQELKAQRDEELLVVDMTWGARYEAYADKLTACVQAEAARIPGLGVPVIVDSVIGADTPHDQVGEHLYDYDTSGQHVDGVAVRLWETCVEAVPRPGAVTDAEAHTDAYEQAVAEAFAAGLDDQADADDLADGLNDD